MRILTAGFDHARSEQLGGLLMAAGHTVLSASGASSFQTLAQSVTPDVVLVPDGEAGDDVATWAPELLSEVPVVRLGVDDDPVAAIDATPRPAEAATEQVSEAAIVAAIEAAAPPPPPALLEPPTTTLDAPRRGAPLRSASAGPDLDDKLHEIRFGDYHAILEVQPGASTYVVRQQYDNLRQLYTPAGWPDPVGPEDIASLTEIGQGLDDAFAVLGHGPYQQRYEAALDAGASSRV